MDAPGPDRKIIRLAARGDGVAEDGTHVPLGVPGDRLLADGTLVPGPGRAVPLCRHFGVCGGCQLQHVADDGLIGFARDRVAGPLARVGLMAREVMPVHLSPPGARRRAAMRATRRGGRVALGFNAGGRHEIVDLAECPVLDPRLFALTAPLRAVLGPHLGEGAAIGATMTLTTGGIDLLLTNLKARGLPAIEGLSAFAREAGLARLSVEGPMGVETLVVAAEPVIRFGAADVTVPPAPFLQATPDGEATLVSAVAEVVGEARRLADLFAGVGTFALSLARRGRTLVAVEGARAPAQALAQAARRAGLAVEVLHRDLFRQPLEAAALDAFDAVVIDPPRAGAAAQMGALAASRVPVVAALSCNPATFARDAAILAEGGYRLGRLWPVAQFRWSTHVELVAEFRRG